MGLAHRDGELAGLDAQHLAQPLPGDFEFSVRLTGLKPAEVGVGDRMAGQGHPALLQCAQPPPVEHDPPEVVRDLPIGPPGDHECGGGNAMMAQHGQGVGQHAGQPIVEGQRELRLVRLSDHLGRGGKAPGIVHGNLQVPFEITRGNVVDPPFRRSNRVIRENPASPARAGTGQKAMTGGQGPTLEAQPSPYGTLVRNMTRPVITQRATNRFHPHGAASSSRQAGHSLGQQPDHVPVASSRSRNSCQTTADEPVADPAERASRRRRRPRRSPGLAHPA